MTFHEGSRRPLVTPVPLGDQLRVGRVVGTGGGIAHAFTR
jgi:hypothetical protein